MDPAERVHQAFLRRVTARDFPPGASPAPGLAAAEAAALFRAQCLSRQLDRQARVMRRAGRGFHTIGSSGHEGIAAVAAALRPGDMAFLHYRDAAFQIARAMQLPGQDPLRDMMLSFAAAAEDPICGGRHKVPGSRALMIPPQGSTIASLLPRAAWSIGAARRLRPGHALLADDAVVLASFGDASVNHATAQAAFDTAGWPAYQGLPLPILFVCEDNRIGISVRTPPGWIAAVFAGRPGLRCIAADGCDLYAAHAAAREAADWVRARRRPVVLHLRMVRLYGHAGADVEAAYRSRAEIEAAGAEDPLLQSVRLMAEAGTKDPDAALAVYAAVGEAVAAEAARAA
ncbi:MAG: thiamine pyrophosphate-dependent enzyme, partial [Gemmobacter sp.]